MPITVLSFDADQTLWDFADVYRRALAATIEAMIARGDVAADQVDADRLQSVRNEIVVQARGRPHNLEAVRERSFEVFLERLGHPDPAAAASDLVAIYMDVRFNGIDLYPEVQASLGRLGERYKLGLLSNGNTYPERCGLPDTFDAVVLGPQLGREKPDPVMFQTLAAELGEPVTSIMHIGDDWDDVQGANDVGATSVFSNRSDADPTFRSQADHEVRDLTELEALLAQH